jgi:hypothetical protein
MKLKTERVLMKNSLVNTRASERLKTHTDTLACLLLSFRWSCVPRRAAFPLSIPSRYVTFESLTTTRVIFIFPLCKMQKYFLSYHKHTRTCALASLHNDADRFFIHHNLRSLKKDTCRSCYRFSRSICACCEKQQ